MTKQDLIDDVARRSKSRRDHVRAVIEAAVQAVSVALAESERVVFSGMGVFTVHTSKKRFRNHPVTKEPYLSKPTRRVKFRPSKSFRSGIGG